MKLLIDNNISHKLIERLEDIFPGSTHVMLDKLDESDDLVIWNCAKKNNYTIITKDADFNEISLVEGFPPKIIWLRIGNCKIVEIEKILRANYSTIEDFDKDNNLGVLEID